VRHDFRNILSDTLTAL